MYMYNYIYRHLTWVSTNIDVCTVYSPKTCAFVKLHLWNSMPPQVRKQKTRAFSPITLPETNIALKIDDWKTTFLLERLIFRGYVSFAEGNLNFPRKCSFNLQKRDQETNNKQSINGWRNTHLDSYPPENERMSPEKGPFYKDMSSSNHHFSGDIPIFNRNYIFNQRVHFPASYVSLQHLSASMLIFLGKVQQEIRFSSPRSPFRPGEVQHSNQQGCTEGRWLPG